MLSAKLLLILAVQVLCALAVPTPINQDELLIPAELTKETLKTQKLDALYEIVKNMMKFGNVTIVGWQLIHDDIDIKEIKTMELVVKNEMKTDRRPIKPYTDTDEELLEELPYILNTMDTLRDRTSVLIIGSTQTWDKNNILENMIYIDDKDIYVMGEYKEIYRMRNTTMENLEKVRNLALKMKTNIPTAILVWNSDGTFDIKESVIVPELMSSIRTHADATPEMMSEALKYLCEGYLLNTGTYLKYLREQMTKSFPKYDWVVIKGHDGSYTNRNIFMALEYHITDISEDSICVHIFGVKKE